MCSQGFQENWWNFSGSHHFTLKQGSPKLGHMISKNKQAKLHLHKWQASACARTSIREWCAFVLACKTPLTWAEDTYSKWRVQSSIYMSGSFTWKHPPFTRVERHTWTQAPSAQASSPCMSGASRMSMPLVWVEFHVQAKSPVAHVQSSIDASGGHVHPSFAPMELCAHVSTSHSLSPCAGSPSWWSWELLL